MIADVLIHSKIDKDGNSLTEEYIEACFVFDVKPECIEEVRFHPGIATQMLDEASLDGTVIAASFPGKISAAKQHQTVLELLEKNRVDTIQMV